jgi:hypothetical protein
MDLGYPPVFHASRKARFFLLWQQTGCRQDEIRWSQLKSDWMGAVLDGETLLTE